MVCPCVRRFVDACTVAHPGQRLRRRRDVVALGAEDDDGRGDVAQVHPRPVGRSLAGRQAVADEELIHDELHLLGIHRDMAAPPFLEAEIARRRGPRRPRRRTAWSSGVGRVEILEVGDEPGAVELAGAEVAGHRRQPGAAEDPAEVAHRGLARDAGPGGDRRSGDHPARKRPGGSRRPSATPSRPGNCR